METLSSSVSTLKVPTLLSTTSSHELITHLKTNTTSSNYSSNYNLLCTKPNSSSLKSNNKTTPKKHVTRTLFYSSISHSLSSPSYSSSTNLHRNPATGYAVALLDMAQRNNSLDRIARDVERLLKIMRDKGQVAIKEIVERGGFGKHLVCLVNMLVGKNKSTTSGVVVVQRVLEEFERIYDEMLETQVVFVSSAKRMSEDEMFGIAKRVQSLSGALRVKVKNFVHHEINSLSFAHV